MGVEEIIATAGVAKMTFYRHFPSKQDLILAFLERREAQWTRAWLEQEVRARASEGRGRLLAIFDVFDEWFDMPDFEGCSFINVLLEHSELRDPVRTASVMHLANIRGLLCEFAEDANFRDPEDLSRKWHILMKGSIVAAGEGDLRAARRAQDIGRALLAAESDRLTSPVSEEPVLEF